MELRSKIRPDQLTTPTAGLESNQSEIRRTLSRSQSLDGLTSSPTAELESNQADFIRPGLRSLDRLAPPPAGGAQSNATDIRQPLSMSPHALEGLASSSAGGSQGDLSDVFRNIYGSSPHLLEGLAPTSAGKSQGNLLDFHRLGSKSLEGRGSRPLREFRSLPDLAPSAGSLDLPARPLSLPERTSPPVESLGGNVFGGNEPGQTGYHTELPGNDVEMGLDRSIDANNPANPSWKSLVWEKTKKWCFTPSSDAPAIPLLDRDSTSYHAHCNYLEIRLRRALLTQAGDVPINVMVAAVNAGYTSYAAGKILPESIASMFFSAYGANKILDYVRAKPYGVVVQAVAGSLINIAVTAIIRAAKHSYSGDS